jgi:proline dehydrogenase
VVIQSYLYRSEKDVAELIGEGANLRIAKGAYREPASPAFPKKQDNDENFMKLVAMMLAASCYVGIATHDDQIIDWVREFVRVQQIDRQKFEFQMLYGVRTGLQDELARQGYKVRCYLPFGKMWYPYFTRRIAESPRNLGFLLRNLIKR